MEARGHAEDSLPLSDSPAASVSLLEVALFLGEIESIIGDKYRSHGLDQGQEGAGLWIVGGGRKTNGENAKQKKFDGKRRH